MAPLGPFEPAPRLAVAVSGGADSMALCVLAADWAAARGGGVAALLVDHGLRAESAAEAAETHARLAALGIPARVLTLAGLSGGAAAARAARHAALAGACADAGIVHLLLGHHAGDQAETVAMRMRAGSTPRGLAGIRPLEETDAVRLVRPLLAVPPARLRATLMARGIGWLEDPSNRDPLRERARVRALRRDVDGSGPATAALVRSAAARAAARAIEDAALAEVLATRASLYPTGHALLTLGPLPPLALGALVAMLSGATRPPPLDRLRSLAAALRPATLGGVRILPAGRLGDGWLLAREVAAIGPPVPARPGASWDGRFQVCVCGGFPDGAMVGALGADAAGHRGAMDLPAAVLRTLPAIRLGRAVLAVPHLGWPPAPNPAVVIRFTPRLPAAPAPVSPADDQPRAPFGDGDGGRRPGDTRGC